MRMAEKLNIPEFQGTAYIYTVYRTCVDFGLYDNKEISTDNLLEIHIFNSEKEYRAIFSTAKNCFIENVCDSDITDHYIDDKMMLYGTEMKRISENQVELKENGKTQVFHLPDSIPKQVFGNPSKTINESFELDDCLYVRNYYSFDENNLLYLEGYRLMGITKGGVDFVKEKE